MSLPPRAPLRIPSLSKISEPPSSKIPPGESKYSDRFKGKPEDTKADAKPDITSAAEFPSLFKGPPPNMILMPKTVPSISFADKVKQMALAEATTKAQAEAERIRRDQENQREQRERERYASIYSGRSTAAIQEDSWNSPCDDEWTPGTPEFGKDEFLNGPEDDDWSNT
jgi:hypothetical protein